MFAPMLGDRDDLIRIPSQAEQEAALPVIQPGITFKNRSDLQDFTLLTRAIARRYASLFADLSTSLARDVRESM